MARSMNHSASGSKTRGWPPQRVALVPGGRETARIRPGLPDKPTGKLGAMPAAPATFHRERGAMLRWWKANERRVVLAVRPVDERTVQIIRKGPFLVECAVVVHGEAVAVFGAGPAWLQASGRAANRAIYGLAAAQLEAWAEARGSRVALAAR